MLLCQIKIEIKHVAKTLLNGGNFSLVKQLEIKQNLHGQLTFRNVGTLMLPSCCTGSSLPFSMMCLSLINLLENNNLLKNCLAVCALIAGSASSPNVSICNIAIDQKGTCSNLCGCEFMLMDLLPAQSHV